MTDNPNSLQDWQGIAPKDIQEAKNATILRIIMGQFHLLAHHIEPSIHGDRMLGFVYLLPFINLAYSLLDKRYGHQNPYKTTCFHHLTVAYVPYNTLINRQSLLPKL